MRARGLVLIFISLILGLAALYFVRGGNTPAQPGPETPTLGIVVASGPLNFGDDIGAG